MLRKDRHVPLHVGCLTRRGDNTGAFVEFFGTHGPTKGVFLQELSLTLTLALVLVLILVLTLTLILILILTLILTLALTLTRRSTTTTARRWASQRSRRRLP